MMRTLLVISGCLSGWALTSAIVPNTLFAQSSSPTTKAASEVVPSELSDSVIRRDSTLTQVTSQSFVESGSNCTRVMMPFDQTLPGKPTQDSSSPAAPLPPGEIPLRPSDISPSPSADSLRSPDSVLSQAQQPSDISPPINSLAAGQGASTAMSQVPSFLGDFFGGPGSQVGPISGKPTVGLQRPVMQPTTSTVGIMKLAENTSPLPRDRVFLSYNYFSDVPLTAQGVNVNRFTPGLEKTFFNGNASVEIRAPLAATLGSSTVLDSQGNAHYSLDQVEFGNLTTYFKALLWRDETIAFSGGLGVGAPTASDTVIRNQVGSTISRISNEAWHLMPFVGGIYTPDDRWYAQTFLQFDVGANGNSVYSQTSLTRPGVARDGALYDPTYLFFSLGGGYWLYQSSNPHARLSRVSLLSELHFNSTLQPTNSVTGQIVRTGVDFSQIQTLNAVVGANIMFDQNKSLLLGYVTPLGTSDMAFAGEFRVLFNFFFGGAQSPAARVQF